MKICSICQEDYGEFGNNATPVNQGRCCDECNYAVVLPARMALMRRVRTTPEPRPRPEVDEG